MDDKFYGVQHQMLVMTYEKPFVNGQWKETWYWDVYSVQIDETSMVKCECTSNGRDVKIPWFKVSEIEFSNEIKDVCKTKMKNTII